MYKRIEFSSVSDLGQTFAEAIDVTPRGGGLEKIAGEMHPEVSRFIRTLRPDPAHQYVLMTPMGSFEFWGMNVNGDVFPDLSLSFDMTRDDPVLVARKLEEKWLLPFGKRIPPGNYREFGHKTFLQAERYRHHCFPAGTPVVMSDRTRRPIDEVRAGDRVATRHGSREVLRVMRRPYLGSGIALGLSGKLEPLTGTAEHPVMVLRREAVHCRHGYNRLGSSEHGNGCPEFRQPPGPVAEVPLSEVREGDYLLTPAPVHGDLEVMPHFAELVGWVASEGALGDRGMIQFTFSQFNLPDIEAVCECLEGLGISVTVTPRPQYGTTHLAACSSHYHSLLSEYVVGTLSEKRLTGKVLEWNRAALLRMLGAYISGDGHVPDRGRNAGQLRIRSSSKPMLHSLEDVVRALGVPCTTNWDIPPGEMASPVNGKVYETTGSGVVAVAASAAPRLLEHSRKTFSRGGACREVAPYEGCHLVRVLSVEGVHLEEDVYNLEVEEEHEYLANEVVVHNCNKDPSKSYGGIVLAVWNPLMHRVEVIVRHDREKAKLVGAEEIIVDLDAGKPRQISMGCFLAGAMVTMADGTRKSIETVEVGDLVITHKGRPRRVTELHRRDYRGEVFDIRAEAHEVIHATTEHPFWAVPSEQVKQRSRWLDEPTLSPDWVTSAELDDHHLLEPVYGEVLTPDYATESLCRLLGYYLAEGHVLRNKKKEICGVEFTTNVDDYIHEEIDKLCEDFGTRNAPHTFERANSERALAVQVFDPKLAQLLYELGGAYARHKKLHVSVLSWHPDLQRHILGAYANGDGTGLPTGALNLSSSSTDLTWQWMLLLPRLGILPSIQNLEHKAGTGFNRRNTYEWVIHIGKQFAQTLRDVCQKVAHNPVEMGKNARRVVDGYVVTPLREIASAYMETEVYNLEVEEDNSYLVAGLAVHNCKVPFDVCTKCGHISRTPGDYCEHLRMGMGSINPDGSINGAVNFFPRFFDLSDVFVPAAKESGVLMKVAGDRRLSYFVPASFFEGRALPEGAVPVEVDAQGNLHKVASVKSAATDKKAEISKEVLPNSSSPSVSEVSRCEPDLPRNVLTQGDLGSLLTTLAGLGIILKPHEFQTASLHRMGLGRYADELDRRGLVFEPERGGREFGMDPSRFSPRLAEAFSSLLGARSGLLPHLPRRVLRVTIIRAEPMPGRAPAPSSEPLKKVAQAYDSYRSSLRALPDLLDVAVREHPGYYTEHFFSELLTDSMEKMASSAFGSSLSTSLVPLYVYSAYRNSAAGVPSSWDLPVARHSPARALIAPTL